MGNKAEIPSEAVLKDGTLIEVRVAGRPEDEMLQEFLNEMKSEVSVLHYFVNAEGKDEHTVTTDSEKQVVIVGLRSGRIIGASFFRVFAGNRAEIALLVSKDVQALGVGTILLGQAIEMASKMGIMEMNAFVPSENRRILDIIKSAGIPVALAVENKNVIATFPTSMLPEFLERYERREAIATSEALRYFFEPKTIAVIGASRYRNTIGGELFHNIIDSGFTGTVFPVNINATSVQSVASYKSVMDCPGNVDMAIIVVPAKSVIQAAEECARKGVRAIVVVSSGFSETGTEGMERQKELTDLCRSSGLRMIGPNCMGLANTDPSFSLNAQFSPQTIRRGEISFLSQSGALGIVTIDLANKLGIGMAKFVSVGNKADISGNDLIEYWENDEGTKIILLYLESFGNPRKFSRISRRVARKKPIVAVKSGRSAAGFRATQSHTGALLAASDVTVDALFRQAGIIRAETLQEMFDVATILASQPVPRGRRVAIITNAGGAGILAADACESYGMEVPELSPDVQESLRKFLPAEAAVRNPVDMTANDVPGGYLNAIKTVAGGNMVDAIYVIYVPAISVDPGRVAREINEAASSLKGKITIVANFMASRGLANELSEPYDSQPAETVRIPSYPFPEDGIKALSLAASYGEWLSLPDEPPAVFTDIRREEAAYILSGDDAAENDGWLSQDSVRKILECYGIAQAGSALCNSPEEAGNEAGRMGVKVVLKGIAHGLVHKTEAGAVVVGLEGRQNVAESARNMLKRLQDAGYSGVKFLVQEQIENAVEMFIGVTNDGNFGPVIACGAGGIMVELIRDVAVSLTPLSRHDAEKMLKSLKTYRLLSGFRGGPTYDTDSLTEMILRLGNLVEDFQSISELDFNPVMVKQKGGGAFVVDARIRITPRREMPYVGIR